jgi:hypothetical protein
MFTMSIIGIICTALFILVAGMTFGYWLGYESAMDDMSKYPMSDDD